MSQPSSAPTIDRPDTISAPDVDAIFRELTGFEEQLDDGSEKDRFSHYAAKEDIVRAAVDGVAITALCGKQWKPSRSPEKYPVCPMCESAYESLQPGDEG